MPGSRLLPHGREQGEATPEYSVAPARDVRSCRCDRLHLFAHKMNGKGSVLVPTVRNEEQVMLLAQKNNRIQLYEIAAR